MEELMGSILGAVLGGILLLGAWAIFGVLTFIIYKKMVGAKSWKKATTICYITLPLGFFPSVIASCIYIAKFKKVLKTNCEMISKTTDNSSVDVFWNYVKEWGFCNKPEQWNQLRGAWFIVNESSNVSTIKKKELRDYLIVNGLRLNNSEKQIIDNYAMK